jgi:hypothetical protein
VRAIYDLRLTLPMNLDDFEPGFMGSPTRFLSALMFVLRETVGEGPVAELLRACARGDARCDSAGCSVLAPVHGCVGAACEGIDVDISAEQSLMGSLIVGVPVSFNCLRERAGGCPCPGCKGGGIGAAAAAAMAAKGLCGHLSVGCDLGRPAI